MAEDIGSLFKKMMYDLERFTKTDETYRKEVKDFKGVIKINWLVCGVGGIKSLRRIIILINLEKF